MYRRDIDGRIVRDDGAVIPYAPGNADFAAVLDWLAAGNTIPNDADDPAFQEQARIAARLAFEDSVTRERDRRIAAGFVFDGKLYQSRATDRENIMGNAQLAFMAVTGGAEAGNLRWADATADFSWIAADNTLVPMDAPTMLAFAKASAAQKARLIFKAREIKDIAPQPTDVTDDKLWG